MKETTKRIDGIYNMMEAVVWDTLVFLTQNRDDICFCSECKRDMTAYALNRVPSYYVSTTEGESRFIKSDEPVRDIIMEAINHVSKNPHRGSISMTEYSANQLFDRLK